MIEREIIIGVDPGLSTGFAVIDPKNRALWASKTFVDCNWSSVLAELTLYDSRRLANTDTVVYGAVEDYHGGVGGKTTNTVNQIIGTVCAAFSIFYGSNMLTLQENIKRKPFIKEAKRILVSCNIVHTPHQVDALAHALSLANVAPGQTWIYIGKD